MAFNIDNFAICTGRLTADPKIFVNADGSRKVRITVATANNYKDSDGSRGAQFIPLEGFLPAGMTSSVYDLMGVGDKVTAEYAVRNNNYVGKDGVQHYDLTLQIDNIKMQESKAITEARRAGNAA